ncbi:MAG TPA: class I SAM-dependent methyltransferase [Terriglobia bacterium]|nr:class I SAM-dependent methyltransferase [Terriglobia bacterium]
MVETIPACPDAAKLTAAQRRLAGFSPRPLGHGAAGMLLLALLVMAQACAHAQNRGPKRDAWQHPGQVMDELGIHTGSVVADVGCGRGYFTFHMAQRVGPSGKVYAVDLQQSWIDEIRKRAAAEGLKQIRALQGKPDDPELPKDSLDVVFAMNTYHEWRQNVAMLNHIYLALKPGALFALIDGNAATSHSREYYHLHHRMPESMERADVLHAGFVFLRQEPGFTQPDDQKQFYFLVFQKPVAQ